MTEAEPPTPENPAPSGPDGRLRTRLLVVIGIVLIVAALRWSEPVSLPLTVAVFLLVLTRPLQCWLEQRSPKWLAVIVTTLVVLLAIAVIAGAVVLGVAQ
ncbi:MAG: AI-2E family transporter, partial [Gemmatimonadaceae bacterium]